MNKIGLFFLRFNGFFVFLILEFFSLYFYFSQNMTSEKSAFLSSSNRTVGNVYDYTNRWMRYWNLSAVNDSLAKENARLKMKLPGSQFSNLTDTAFVKDADFNQQYKYTEAIVINNSIQRRSNYLTLNRGSKHGIRLNSGVLNGIGEGIAGVVIAVSQHYSTVMSVLHEDIRISAKVKRTGYFGVMTWHGKDPQKMTLEAVPKHAKVLRGDTIVTSGYSSMFPEGVMIGKIESYSFEHGSNFYSIQVNLFVDMNKLQYVYVVDDLMREERKEIEEKAVK
jgi:rod shape-determining protein MreC